MCIVINESGGTRTVTFARKGGGMAKLQVNEIEPSRAVAEAFKHYNASWETVTDVRVDGKAFSRAESVSDE